QATGLNHLPRLMHPHGAAIIGTVQQVSGAVGTALLVTVMTTQTHAALALAGAGTSPAARLAATAHGFHSAFTVSAVLSVVPLALVLWLVLHLKRAPAPAAEGGPVFSGH
ncbi:MAG TPA: hypothetical protein VM490_12970, partial [Armatimonadaceae bacterium]|nr:hypothetical protein [Armatimonadaceae bacterium]